VGFYNVLRPCVVGKLHYASVPSQPIEVDDEIAAPLVESAALQPYPKPVAGEPAQDEPALSGLGDVAAEVRLVDGDGEQVDYSGTPVPRPRSRRKSSED